MSSIENIALGTEHAQVTRAKQRKYGQWIVSALIILLGLTLVNSLWNNPRLRVDIIAEYLFSPLVLKGVLVTIELTIIVFFFGVVLGLGLALMSQARNPTLRSFAWGVTWVFRALPPLLQLIIWAFLAALYPQLSLTIPFLDITLFSVDTNLVMKPYVAAVICFTLIEMAYQSEAIRAGLQSVASTQIEAAQALGYSKWQTLTRIIVPQAMPAMLAPSVNNLIILLKGTSIVSVIGATELLTTVQNVYAETYQIIPMLIVAGIWYMILTSILMLVQRYLEKRYTRGRIAAGGERG